MNTKVNYTDKYGGSIVKIDTLVGICIQKGYVPVMDTQQGTTMPDDSAVPCDLNITQSEYGEKCRIRRMAC